MSDVIGTEEEEDKCSICKWHDTLNGRPVCWAYGESMDASDEDICKDYSRKIPIIVS